MRAPFGARTASMVMRAPAGVVRPRIRTIGAGLIMRGRAAACSSRTWPTGGGAGADTAGGAGDGDGEGDGDGDGALTVDDLDRYLAREVPRAAAARDREQHPLVIARDRERAVLRAPR